MVHFDTFKNIIISLKQNKIRYWVFGGFALDGIRGKITREHKDIDIYLHAKDYCRIKFCRIENMLPLKSRVIIQTVKLTEENGLVIANHRYAHKLIKYPKEIFDKNINVSISNFKFRIVPYEVLVFISKFSSFNVDKSFCAKLECDKEQLDKIKEVKMK